MKDSPLDVTGARSSLGPWLWLSVPAALLALLASAAGLFGEDTYATETRNWAAQAAGQDAVNLLLAYPVLLLLTWAGRRSLRAYLAWLGVLGYSAYSYLLYAGYLHFSAWFLIYVAVLGLSTWALVGGLAVLDPARVRGAFEAGTPVRWTAGVLITFGALYYLLWLSEVVPASLGGAPPPSVVEAGLITNPVHILDMAFVLPAMLVTGLLLWRRRALGYLLATPLLGFAATMGAAIIGMFVMLALWGEPIATAPVAMMALTTLVAFGTLLRFLAGIRSGIPAAAAVRGSVDADGPRSQ